jgi:hypothetical protein
MANRLRLFWLGGLVAAALAPACDGGGGPTNPFSKAAVRGVAFVDYDLDGRYTPPVDAPAPGVVTALLRQGTTDTAAKAVAGPNGAFLMLNVDVGHYTLVAGRGAVIGDSLTIMPIDSADMVLAANDTASREVRLSFSMVTVAQLAQTPIGRKVSLEGIALNTLATFRDSTIHLVDRTGFTRAVRVRPVVVNERDSIRIFGAETRRPLPAMRSPTPWSGSPTPPSSILPTSREAAAWA